MQEFTYVHTSIQVFIIFIVLFNIGLKGIGGIYTMYVAYVLPVPKLQRVLIFPLNYKLIYLVLFWMAE